MANPVSARAMRRTDTGHMLLVSLMRRWKWWSVIR